MKSKKFSFYYLLFVLFTLCCLFALAFSFKSFLFGFILFHPAYILWVLLSIILWIIGAFIKSEKGFKILNWLLVFLPFILLILLFIFEKILIV